MTTHKKNFLLSTTHIELLGNLQLMCDLKTETDVVEEALVLLAWAAAEVRRGNKISSIDEVGKTMREITSPALLGAASRAARAKRA